MGKLISLSFSWNKNPKKSAQQFNKYAEGLIDRVRAIADRAVVGMRAHMLRAMKKSTGGNTYVRGPVTFKARSTLTGRKVSMSRLYFGTWLIRGGKKIPVAFYRGGKRNVGRTHIASKPGNAPATDTGTLGNSIQVTSLYQNGGKDSRVAVKAKYARYLEFGATLRRPRGLWARFRGRGKIRPRPFVRPAFRAGAAWAKAEIAKLGGRGK